MLYVVDSVTRQWLEQARKAGQALGPSATDGTFAAGVNHVTELLPALMQDIISVAPEDQKVRFLGMLPAIVWLEYFKHMINLVNTRFKTVACKQRLHKYHCSVFLSLDCISHSRIVCS